MFITVPRDFACCLNQLAEYNGFVVLPGGIAKQSRQELIRCFGGKDTTEIVTGAVTWQEISGIIKRVLKEFHTSIVSIFGAYSARTDGSQNQLLLPPMYR